MALFDSSPGTNTVVLSRQHLRDPSGYTIAYMIKDMVAASVALMTTNDGGGRNVEFVDHLLHCDVTYAIWIAFSVISDCLELCLDV